MGQQAAKPTPEVGLLRQQIDQLHSRHRTDLALLEHEKLQLQQRLQGEVFSCLKSPQLYVADTFEVLVGLLTGHAMLNRHLAFMKIRTYPLCSACGEEEEAPYHFLGRCSGRMLDRMSVLGSFLLELKELRKVKPNILNSWTVPM